jgi:NAD(P)-dependent dehydrogenase (short-subunit alcohol dehydrogenase family)
LWAVVNNAGIAIGGPLDWIGLDVYRRVMEVNFFGHVLVTKTFLPLLKQQKHSRVVNLSSIAGIGCSANLSAYGASKHAMEGFMKSVRHELMPWNIHVSNINPGFMRSTTLLLTCL